MKKQLLLTTITFMALAAFGQSQKFSSTKTKSVESETQASSSNNQLFIDEHDLTPGKVNFADVMAAHQKDLATERKYGTQFLKFWVDEAQGKVYCLVSASDSQSIVQTHAEAHGLLPSHIYPVTAGKEAALQGKKNLFLDVHYLGAGNVTKEAVAGAHEKDLAVQHKYGVNLINYWVDERDGIVMCLAQAKDSTALISTHKEAHGLLPDHVEKVKQGQ